MLELFNGPSMLGTSTSEIINLRIDLDLIHQLSKPICVVLVVHVKISLENHHFIQCIYHLLESVFLWLDEICEVAPHLLLVVHCIGVQFIDGFLEHSCFFLSLSHPLAHVSEGFGLVSCCSSLFDSSDVELLHCFLELNRMLCVVLTVFEVLLIEFLQFFDWIAWRLDEGCLFGIVLISKADNWLIHIIFQCFYKGICLKGFIVSLSNNPTGRVFKWTAFKVDEWELRKFV